MSDIKPFQEGKPVATINGKPFVVGQEIKGDEVIDAQYCIPNWLKDEQIRLSIERVKKRIKPVIVTKPDPIALVCFGPSLKESWPDLKNFKYIMTCSGSHKFIREKGFTPTYHVDVDPRPHKVALIGDDISPDTEFLICSTCHPKLFDHLESHNANITLWHGYDGSDADEVLKVIPKGEWVITGGSNVGLRALVICRFLGFTNIHLFGMDGNFEKDGLRHAAEHPNAPKEYITTVIDGITYYTTPAYYLCAQQFFHEWSLLPDVAITLHGTGMIQHMACNKMRDRIMDVKVPASSIAFLTPPNTISRDYIYQNRLLHSMDPDYGLSGANYISRVRDLYHDIDARTLLDYGCGKGALGMALDFPIWEYDPAIEGKDRSARPADLVTCIDVLEHIEPEFLEETLQDLKRCTKKMCFVVLNTGKSGKTLPDGRNTHLIQQSMEWWLGRLSKYFDLLSAGVEEVNEFQADTKLPPRKIRRIIIKMVPKVGDKA
jgi:hypothetical protein